MLLYCSENELNKLTAYYFKDLMSKVKLYSCKWTVEEVFECKDLVSFFISKTEDNKNVFESIKDNPFSILILDYNFNIIVSNAFLYLKNI